VRLIRLPCEQALLTPQTRLTFSAGSSHFENWALSRHRTIETTPAVRRFQIAVEWDPREHKPDANSGNPGEHVPLAEAGGAKRSLWGDCLNCGYPATDGTHAKCFDAIKREVCGRKHRVSTGWRKRRKNSKSHARSWLGLNPSE